MTVSSPSLPPKPGIKSLPWKTQGQPHPLGPQHFSQTGVITSTHKPGNQNVSMGSSVTTAVSPALPLQFSDANLKVKHPTPNPDDSADDAKGGLNRRTLKLA